MKNRTIEFLAILYLLMWTIFPPMQVGMIYRLAALGCAAILALLNGFRFNRKDHGLAILFILLVAVTAIIKAKNISAAMGQIAVYMLFLGYLMNYWYKDNWCDFEFLIPVALVMFAFWNYRSITVLATDPNAARAVVRDDERALYYLEKGVGGYGLTYCQVCIVPAIVSWILNVFKKNKLFFICGVLWAVSYYIYLGLAGYTIAVVASVISLLILFFYRYKNAIPALAISFILVVILVYAIGYNTAIRNHLLNVFDGTRVADKIRDITTTLETDDTADSIYGRVIKYMASIKVMLRYPIVGSLWKGGTGGHSTLLDMFAQYGLFGGIMYCKMLYGVVNDWKKRNINMKTLRTINATIVSLTFVALLDAVPFNIVLAPTVILPIILSSVNDGEDRKAY